MNFKPVFQTAPLVDGLKWPGGHGWRYEEKLDGRWHQLNIGQSTIVGELLHGGAFYAFDIPIFNGSDIRRNALTERLNILTSFRLLRPACGSGGEFLETVLARGGEGIVAKRLDSFYGELDSWVKCKTSETHDCIVTEIHPAKRSVHLTLEGQDAGWCAVLGPVFNELIVGDMVEVVCHSRHASRRLREPRFVRIRQDKMEAAL